MFDTILSYENGKYVIFFRRVSSESQSLKMQEARDEEFRNQLPEGSFVILEEEGVSANKLSLTERTEMVRLITFIRAGKVSKIYVYDRSRLVRDFYQHMLLMDLFKKYGVEVEFTTEDKSYLAYSDDMRIEGMFAIISDEEGNNIARRTRDARLKFPPQKFGYLKRNKDETRYNKDPKYQQWISEIFEYAHLCHDSEKLLEGIERLRKGTKRSTKEILRMLVDPFYAGLHQINQRFYPLPYVEPYVDEDAFVGISERLSKLIAEIKKTEMDSERNQIMTPYCYRCKEKMKFQPHLNFKQGKYTCNIRKCKVSILQDDFNKELIDFINELLSSCKVDECHQLMRNMIKKTVSRKQHDKKSTTVLIEKLQLKLVQEYQTNNSILLEQIERARTKLNRMEQESSRLERYLQQQKLLSELPVNLSDLLFSELALIIRMVAGKVYVNQDSLHIQVYENPYLKASQFRRNVI